MTAEHTPGPWSVEGRGVTVKMGDRAYAGVDQNEGVPFTEAMANAHLIAAAPTMLEALRKCEDWLVSVGADGAPLPAVREAIRKAAGK